MAVGAVARRVANPLAWDGLPRIAQVYVAAISAVGAVVFVLSLPHSYPDPWLLGSLLLLSCVTSAWKVTLPLSLSSGATLSVSYAADLMALLLLGPGPAVMIAVAGAWMQCTFRVKQSYPLYRTGFSMSAEAITMVATGLTYASLGGPGGAIDLSSLARPLVGAIATYFASIRVSWVVRSRSRQGAAGGKCGTTNFCGARPVSWWRAAPARSPRSSSSAGAIMRHCFFLHRSI